MCTSGVDSNTPTGVFYERTSWSSRTPQVTAETSTPADAERTLYSTQLSQGPSRRDRPDREVTKDQSGLGDSEQGRRAGNVGAGRLEVPAGAELYGAANLQSVPTLLVRTSAGL